MRRIALIASALLAAACATVHQTAHVGVHFQADLGAGGSQSTASESGVDAKYSGPAGLISVGVGGAAAPNLIVGAQLWGSSVSDVRFTLNGQSETLTNVTYDVYGFGPMLKYYFMPANVYVAATPSIAQLSLSNDHSSDETRWGPALRLAVGKEWYASMHWGLGIAGVLHLASNKPEGGGPTWSTVGGGVVFSASYN